MKKIIPLIPLAVIFMLLLSPVLATAADSSASVSEKIKSNLNDAATNAGFNKDKELPETVGLVINIVLSIMGVIFVVLMVYGGVLWMTSYGAEEKVKRAKELITDAVIGLVIVMISYAIAQFVVSKLVEVTVK